MGRFRKEPEDPGGFIAPGGAVRVKELSGSPGPCGTGEVFSTFEFYGSEYFLQ